ncbi:hypothetical protein HanIR_Chr03g0107361 [Helianthus annuus]|nr:hypothetical protein HanIR_Chr03g0107361 [Helianthus annuus]
MYPGLSHIKATFVKLGFYPIYLINKNPVFYKTLIFFLTHGPDEISAALLF